MGPHHRYSTSRNRDPCRYCKVQSRTRGSRTRRITGISSSAPCRLKCSGTRGCIGPNSGHASLTKRKLTIQYIDEILNNIVPRTTPDLSIEAIQEAVARYFRLKVNDLRGSQRRQSIVRPRHVAMYLCRKHVSKASFPAIGDQFGKKDHATVMNAVKKIDRALESDRSLQSQIQDLEQQLDIPQTTKS